jgi:hypothetical protein
MAALIILALVAAALTIGILVAIILQQDRVIATQRKALDASSRAASREHAAVEILVAELKHLSHTAQLVTLWRPRHTNPLS